MIREIKVKRTNSEEAIDDSVIARKRKKEVRNEDEEISQNREKNLM